MLPLTCSDPPSDFDSTVAAFQNTLRKYISGADLESRLTVQPGTWPSIANVTADLTGTTLQPDRPAAVDLANLQAGFTIDQLAFQAEPLTVNSANVRIRATAEQLQLSFARDAQQRVVMVPTDVAHGEVTVEIAQHDLQTLLLFAARQAAQEHDATIDDATLQLEQQGDRAARFATTVQARKGMFQATLKISGKIELSENLTLRLDDLTCEGEGMLGGMLAAIVSPQLTQYNATAIPLAEHALGEVRIEHLQFDVTQGLSVQARFAGRQS